MGLDASFCFGPFLVDEAGGLSPRSPDDEPDFAVRWRDRRVRVRLTAATEMAPAGTLALHVLLGLVPSTAASARRGDVLAMLHGLPSCLQGGWKLDLLADHSIGLRAARPIPPPATASVLVAEISLFLMALSPYLDLLGESGLAALPGGGTAGMANTWPG
jgi:hypothetical protein